jgi:charged multivesicular body protein 1
MDEFEKQFEDLDVKSNYVENAINQTTTLSTPADEVETLIHQVADEHGLDIAGQFTSATAVPLAPAASQFNVLEEQDELSARLARLRS